MSNPVTYPIPSSFADASITPDKYQQMYRQSLDDPDTFWSEQADEFLSWDTRWHTVCDSDIHTGYARWFDGGELNASLNCIDRHLPARAQQTAILWEGDDPNESRHITYQELKDEVCRLANVMRNRGVQVGDRVCIYMPMVPEATYAMLACARIGAIHSVVFGGFSPEALKDRINDASCRMVITADEGLRAGKTIPLKANVDAALSQCPTVDTVIVLERTNAQIHWEDGRDIAYATTTATASTECTAVSMASEAPLFILYTSGSTGKPKGVLHTTGGYLLQAANSFKYVFDYREGEVFWCTADVGWVTGHSYIVYGPLANGATTVMFEGVPTYPDGGRCWEVIDKHQINTFFTAPTAIRALQALGDDLVTKHSSFRFNESTHAA